MRSVRGVWVAFALVLPMSGFAHSAELPPFTVSDARSLPTPQLANELLGARLGSRVIEAKRYEYEGSSGTVPKYVEFFTQPELSSPVANGICRTDVITIEYDWVEHDVASSATALKIARVAAKTRYKAFPEPPPGSDAYTKTQKAACAAMRTASDSFRAPTGGDAQWLAAIQREYSNPASRFAFTCDDFADGSCTKARQVLLSLPLNAAKQMQLVDCPKVKTGDQVDYCYRIVFNYPEEHGLPDISDYDEPAQPEWIVTVFAGLKDGFAPVRIRSLHLEHDRQSFGIP
jgi:hypothetical protein